MKARLRWTAFGGLIGVLLTTIAFLALRNYGARPLSVVRTLDAPAVVREIQRLNELVSVKYTVQKGVGLEEKKAPFGSAKLLLFVQAEVLPGVAFSEWGPGVWNM